MKGQSDWWTVLPCVQLQDWCHAIVSVRVQQTWIINCSVIPILWMIHSLSASLNVYSVHVKQEQKHRCIPRKTEALLGLTVFSCPHQQKEPTNLKLLSSRENIFFPHLFHTRVFNYEFIQTKISEISLLQQSLAWGAFKPTTAEQKGRSRAPAFQTISFESMLQPV